MKIANTVTSTDNLVARLGAESEVGSPPKRFLIRRMVQKSDRSQEFRPSTTTSDVEMINPPTPVRVPVTGDLPGRVRVLQLWNGIVQEVKNDRFIALVRDRTNAAERSEVVELDLGEVSTSDRPLVREGATFYWSIAYRDAPSGQRERVSSLRFARQPRASNEQVARIFYRADRLAALLEDD
jgi:hypothetical protein